jgi:hypothetical protein
MQTDKAGRIYRYLLAFVNMDFARYVPVICGAARKVVMFIDCQVCYYKIPR